MDNHEIILKERCLPEGKLYKLIIKALLFTLIMILLSVLGYQTGAKAADLSSVEIGIIDYEALEMQIIANGNAVISYSVDKATWYELEAPMDANGIYRMDISWVSSTADTSLYFKGDSVKTIVSVIIPKQNTSFKAVFDKVDGSFTFSETGDAEEFQWRNTTDYSWHTVSLEDGTEEYTEFLCMIEAYRIKNTKIVVRTKPINGTGAKSTGSRPSKEVSIAIAARTAAPSIKVNVKKMTLNTTTSLEYYDEAGKLWVDCEKLMTIQEIAPAALFENGSQTVTVLIRKAETEKSPYSKSATVVIPGQKAAPTVGDSTKEVTYYYTDSRLVLQFPQASASQIYEYTIIKPENDFDINTASWTTVKKASLIKISTSKASEGSVIYFRKAGTAEVASKNISLELPSAYSAVTISWK